MGPPKPGVVVIAFTIRSTSPTSRKTRSRSFGLAASAITPAAPGTSSTSKRIVSSLRATPATRQPSAAKSVASTRPRFRAPKTRSAGIADLCGDAGELRDDLVSVRLQRVFLAVRHEVDVEL